MPSVLLKGSLVNNFVRSINAAKEATATANKAKEALREVADRAYFERVCEDRRTIPSIELVDSTGAVATYTSQNKYSLTDVDTVNKLFKELHRKADNYCVEVVSASFDSSLLMGEDGTLNVDLFEAYFDAIDAVANRFKVKNPLVSTTAVKVKPDFHEKRSSEFTASQNLSISGTLSNTVTLTAVSEGTDPLDDPLNSEKHEDPENGEDPAIAVLFGEEK